MITTKRLKIYPISFEELKEVIEKEKNDILKIAYSEMLSGCMKNLEDIIWYTLWFIELNNSNDEIIGTLSFKGLSNDGIVEIGYGIDNKFEGNGYTTEAVNAVVNWAAVQPNVKRIEAEAEESNIASIRVLEKCNFIPNGEIGEEGIRFVWNGK